MKDNLLFDIAPIEKKPKQKKEKVKVIRNSKLRDAIIKKIHTEFKITINSIKYSYYELYEFYDKYKIIT